MMELSRQPLTVITGDCRERLKFLPAASVHCCVTSPPYWGLRDYGHPDQLGQENTPEEYVESMRTVFAELHRVLRSDGTLWLNLSDTYYGSWGNYVAKGREWAKGMERKERYGTFRPPMAHGHGANGLKRKDLCGIPWRVAQALQADGWYVRSDIIWHKANAMPESVTDRPAKAHEYMFLLSKSERYFYDAEAIKAPASPESAKRLLRGSSEKHKYVDGVPGQAMHSFVRPRPNRNGNQDGHSRRHAGFNDRWEERTESERVTGMCNKRTVWTVPTHPYKGAHFATYPPDLIAPCILAGTSALGCCRRCGEPWRRVTSKGEPLEEWKKRCGADSTGGYHGRATKNFDSGKAQDASAVKARILAGMREIRTIGWQLNCRCNEGEPTPCTVLDPFAGSGTTGQVALDFGRRAILIELNPEYRKLIHERCGRTLEVVLTA